jgi:signal transduction histidine kinase
MILLAIEDVTDRRRAEMELREQSAALADANARLQDLSRRLTYAHEEERQRITRELHDEIGQTLTGLRLYIHQVRRNPTSEALDELQSIVSEAVDRVREISQDLHPQILSDMGLKAALEWSFQRYHERTGVSCGLSCPEILGAAKLAIADHIV